MAPLTDAERYHERTKHSWESVRGGGRVLSWEDKPRAFKRYPEAGRVKIPRELPRPEVPALAALAGAAEDPGSPLDFRQLARVLRWGAGVMRTLRVGGEGYHFRTYSSAGALYPIEVYVACGELAGLRAGLYHFHPRDLVLQRLRDVDARLQLAGALAAEGLTGAGAVLCLTGILWRTAWKYGERGYRHLFWDAGTMLANLIALASSTNLGPRVYVGFEDREVDAVLGLDGEREAALAALAIGEGAPATGPGVLGPLYLNASPLSRREEAYPEAWAAHAASFLNTPDDVRTWRRSGWVREGRERAAPAGSDLGLSPDPLETVLARRGSTRAFAPHPISEAELALVLQSAGVPIPLDSPPLDQIHVIVHAVEGLDPGVYLFSPAEGLRQVRAGDFREEASYLCLEQELGGSGAATLFFLCDLPGAVKGLGERGYRSAQLEAGIRTGRAYLAAYAQGLGATALTFYDDAVAEFLTGDVREQPMMCVSVGVDARRQDLRRLRGTPSE